MWSISSETFIKYFPCLALQREVKSEIEKTLEKNAVWYQAPFVLVLTVKKGPFPNTQYRKKNRENIVFVGGHVH